MDKAILEISLSVSERARDRICKEKSSITGFNAVPGIIWQRDESGLKWTIGYYDENKTSRDGYPGILVTASTMQFVVVQHETLDLLRDSVLDFENEQFTVKKL